MILYQITNLLNGKQYIGQTIESLERRFDRHFYYKGKSSLLSPAMRKHGRDMFKAEILETATSLEELNRLEQRYISAHNTLHPLGYNLLSGGGGHSRHHEETRRKMSISRKGGKPNLGHKHSEETKKRMSEKKKLPRPAKSRIEKNNNRNSQACKAAYGFNSETQEGIYLKSVRLGKCFGFDPGHISANCLGKTKQHKGFVWSFINGWT